MVKHPVIQNRGVLGKVFKLGFVGKGVHTAGNGASLEHGDNIGASPAPGVATAVEDAVKVDGVHLPASCDSRDVLVQACDQCDMARTRFGRHTGVGDAKGTLVEDSGADKRSEGSRDEVGFGLGVRLGEGLESLVGTQTVTCRASSRLASNWVAQK